MEPQANNASAKIITALIIGLLVGFAAGVFWQERRTSGALKNTAATGTAAEETASAVTGSAKATESTKTAGTVTEKLAAAAASTDSGLRVANQTAGSRVEVTGFGTKEIVWVAVREEKDGVLGNILGAQKVFVGDEQKVTVELLRPTVSGGTYRVVVYRDIGTPAFNYREDVLIEGVEGKFTAK